MKLSELQSLFYRVVAGDDDASMGALERACDHNPAQPARTRISLYAGMYHSRLTEALHADFPKVAALLGEPSFTRLAAIYIRLYPSEHYDIGRVGRHFASFLREWPEAGLREDAADLAALEWARAEVFIERDQRSLERHAWVELLAADPSTTHVALIPALRLVHLTHDVMPLFRAIVEGSHPCAPTKELGTLVVWRVGLGPQVFHARVSTQEAIALERARMGATVAEICGPFADCIDPAEAAFTALSSWGDEGLIAASAARTAGPRRQT
jgi:hypothetical protein